MNWGLRIIILYTGFVALMVTLVVLSCRQRVDLVSQDYYKKELVFQQRIDRIRRSDSLPVQPQVSLSANNVEVKFPRQPGRPSGEILFYRASDARRDFTLPVAADTSGLQQVPVSKFIHGLYEVQLTWSAGGKDFYNEIPLFVQ